MAASAGMGVQGGAAVRSLNRRRTLTWIRCCSSPSCISSSGGNSDGVEEVRNDGHGKGSSSFFPKKGQTLELECESLAFKAKGVCKVPATGFVLMCDRALPGERFIGRVVRKKGSYAEVKKLKTLSPHHYSVDAPCQYASHCGGCKLQNLSYEAQVAYKEQQVRELMVHLGRFSLKDPCFSAALKPIVPCAVHYHYRNKMEFSFSTDKWLPVEEMEVGMKDWTAKDWSLGLHAPGFFDKVVQIETCLLQSKAADKLFKIVGEILI